MIGRSAGDTVESLRRALTRNLPPADRPITSGLLHYRLTKPSGKRPPVPAQRAPDPRPHSRLVECDDCGHPGPTLLPGDLCGECIRKRADPKPPSVVDLGALLDGYRRRKRLTDPPA